MEIIQVFEDKILYIAITGQLDANTSIQLDDAIKKAINEGKYNIIFNFEGVMYISSAGLGVFISHLDDIRGFGGKFVFYQMNDTVYNIFKILGLHNLMEIVGNVREAKMLMDES